jgi:Zinc-binding dehydrogenase
VADQLSCEVLHPWLQIGGLADERDRTHRLARPTPQGRPDREPRARDPAVHRDSRARDLLVLGEELIDRFRVLHGVVAVVGDGAVGLCAIIAARRLGAARIIALSGNPRRQDLARSFGATDILAERGDAAIEAVREMTDGVGVDAALEEA